MFVGCVLSSGLLLGCLRHSHVALSVLSVFEFVCSVIARLDKLMMVQTDRGCLKASMIHLQALQASQWITSMASAIQMP